MNNLNFKEIPKERIVTFDNVKYGMLLEYLNKEGYGYHVGVKVHFFNKRGVLVGNFYEFVPYERLRLREDSARYGNRQYPHFFIGQPLSKLKQFVFVTVLKLITFLIKKTQKYID